MERSALLRWLVIGAALLLFWKFGMPMLRGEHKEQNVPQETYVDAPGFAPDKVDGAKVAPPEGETCVVKGPRFEATLSTRGAALTKFILTDAQYAAAGGGSFDMSTTPGNERWRSLRTTFRGPGADDQLAHDRFPWTLEPRADEASCTFSYEADGVRLEKHVAANERPYELAVTTKVTNLADAPKKHRLTVGVYASRTNGEVKGNLGRVSPFQSELSCAGGKDVVRKAKDEFHEGWFSMPGVDRYAAVNNHYFSQALLVQPSDGPTPDCQILAEEWFAAGQARDADDAGAIYHARLVYPPRELAPKADATYTQIAFFGPKEREVLAKAGGGAAKLGDVVNLGFFSPVAKVLISILVWIQRHVTFGNWGVAIILMTIGLRTLLFPLTLKSIKATIGMRKLKPELDALNEKFKDDAQARGLATMELYKKSGANPAAGCLPQLVQMPVWFAMYTTLQTAVEMYHTKFLWFADLSAPDKFYVLPLLLGAFMILQQKIMPPTGMDPAQQKMMTYFMPGMFTLFMLFLPAALGVYMLTNSLLAIGQQLVVEKVAPRNAPAENVAPEGPGSRKPHALGKGKARV